MKHFKPHITFTFHVAASRVRFAHLAPGLFFSRGMFRTPSNIEDEVFLRIQLTTLRCWLFTQKRSILDVWRGSEYACVQIAPGNVLFHHSKPLMEYFEFLHGSRIICLPSNISDKLRWHYVFGKLKNAETHRLHFC